MQILAVVGKQHLAAGWSELEWGVRTGERIFERAYGESFFKRCKSNMAVEDTYSKGMSELDHTCEPFQKPPTICEEAMFQDCQELLGPDGLSRRPLGAQVAAASCRTTSGANTSAMWTLREHTGPSLQTCLLATPQVRASSSTSLRWAALETPVI